MFVQLELPPSLKINFIHNYNRHYLFKFLCKKIFKYPAVVNATVKHPARRIWNSFSSNVKQFKKKNVNRLISIAAENCNSRKIHIKFYTLIEIKKTRLRIQFLTLSTYQLFIVIHCMTIFFTYWNETSFVWRSKWNTFYSIRYFL